MLFSDVSFLNKIESIIHNYQIENNLTISISKKEKIIKDNTQNFFHIIDEKDCYTITTIEQNNHLKYIVLSIYTGYDFFGENLILKIILNPLLNILSYTDERNISNNEIFKKIVKEAPVKDKLRILAGADQDTNHLIHLCTDMNLFSFPFFSYLVNNLEKEKNAY